MSIKNNAVNGGLRVLLCQKSRFLAQLPDIDKSTAWLCHKSGTKQGHENLVRLNKRHKSPIGFFKSRMPIGFIGL